MSDVKNKLVLLPNQPGCYLMKNKDNEVIYVGKAKNLKNRVRSYFTGSLDAKTQRLVMDIVDFEYIVTLSTLEALILECNLIKKYRPRYNVMLKDDKSYPYIRLTKEKHPRLEVTRKIKKDGSRYFGPYPNAGAAQQTKKLLDRLFPLRKCRNLPKRVCLYYHLEQCLAPCEFKVDNAEYEEMIRKITSFLNGNHPEIKKELRFKMEQAAEALEFEQASELRDLIQDIDVLMERQSMVVKDQVDRDVFAYAANKGWMCVQVFFIRQGKLLEREVSLFAHYHEAQDDFISYVAQFYHQHPSLPKEVILPPGTDEELIEGLLKEVKVIVPQRGLKRDWILLAEKNAQLALEEKFHLLERDESRTLQAIYELGEVLNLGLPRRIEAFDNSNIQGTDPVSAMVVFIDGKPAKNEYRKYKIRTVGKPDDYETMREVIRRRYTRVLKEKLPMPDVILVDGGRGQVSAATEVLEDELGLYIPVAGMVKDDKHQTSHLYQSGMEQALKRGSQAFYLIQRIQEEVHRFALTFHRQQRAKSMLESELDRIPGIGAKRKAKLYQVFGSIDKMKEASMEDYQKAGFSEKLGRAIKEALEKIGNSSES